MEVNGLRGRVRFRRYDGIHQWLFYFLMIIPHKVLA
jgi:hypothetical protein